jgi:hypothetical protein
MNDLQAVLAERGSRYGDFLGHAQVTMGLKQVISSELQRRGKWLAPDQQEALDMICHKIGRIVNGDPDYDDSWRDIAGYAQLVCDRLVREAQSASDEGGPASNSEEIRSSLLERVAGAIAEDDTPVDLWHDDARAAIREVAAWLRDRVGGTRACWLLDVEAGQ